MKKTLGITGLALAAIVACGSDRADDASIADAGPEPDGGARSEDDADVDASRDAGSQPDADAGPPRGFEIRSKDAPIRAQQEITFCYHFRTTNTEAMAIRRWKSVASSGVTAVDLFFGGTNEAPGTLSGACPSIGGTSASNPPVWAYTSTKPEGELTFPADDGSGKPLAFEVPAEREGYLRIHHRNPTDQPITAHVTLTAEALPEGVAFTKTSSFFTYNSALSIPAFATNHVETKTCNTLPNTKFWFMSMQTHKQAIRMTVKNGEASTVATYESTDWANPDQKVWPASPFYAFDTGKLTYECAYTNPTNRTITSGNSAAVEETCTAIGYYFPADKPVTCYCIEAGCVNF